MTSSRILTIILVTSFLTTLAQPISQIKIGVNGLTCSACTRSVEMSLSRLDFVDSVAMSLENTEGVVYTKELLPPDFNKIAKAVTDAGFSVRFLEANLAINNTQISAEGCFSLRGINFKWIGFSHAEPTLKFTFIDSNFLPAKEYSKWKKKISPDSCFPGKPVFLVVNAE